MITKPVCQLGVGHHTRQTAALIRLDEIQHFWEPWGFVSTSTKPALDLRRAATRDANGSSIIACKRAKNHWQPLVKLVTHPDRIHRSPSCPVHTFYTSTSNTYHRLDGDRDSSTHSGRHGLQSSSLSTWVRLDREITGSQNKQGHESAKPSADRKMTDGARAVRIFNTLRKHEARARRALQRCR